MDINIEPLESVEEQLEVVLKTRRAVLDKIDEQEARAMPIVSFKSMSVTDAQDVAVYRQRTRKLVDAQKLLQDAILILTKHNNL